MADVFISYSKTRVAEAAELANELGDLGFDVWWDTSLLPTGSFGAEIDRQLDAATAVIVIWSPESVRSKWVRSEAAHGDRQDKLVNTHTGELNPALQIPKPFDQIHSVAVDEIRTIVRALDALGVARSGGQVPDAQPVVAPVSIADADDRLFAEVERTGTSAAYWYYLDELPDGRHAVIAKFRLRTLSEMGAAVSSDNGSGPADKPALESRAGASLRRQLAMQAMPIAELADKLFPDVATSQNNEEAIRKQQQEKQYRAEGRIFIDASYVDNPTGKWFLPGDGNRAYFKDHDLAPDMVVIPAGSFMMGSPKDEERHGGDEEPQHEVAIARPLAVGRYAITFDEWDAAVRAGGISHKPEDQGWGRGQRPVINVSWDDAISYCQWLSKLTGQDYRLLSEAEWEYACRAGTQTPFWWDRSISTDQANYNGNRTYGSGKKGKYRERTEPVDSFEPNPWGLYQMHGNVWEWCADNWHENYRGAPEDGSVWQSGDASFCVVRGGSWINNPRGLRSAYRAGNHPVYRYLDLGFRVSRTLTP